MQSKPLSWSEDKDIAFIATLLRDGKVVVGSSDTVIGLLALATRQGFERLNSIKQRTEKPYIVLVASINQAQQLMQVPDTMQLEKVLQTFWPGPLTIIVPAHPQLPSYLKAPNNTIALRVPDHSGLQRLLHSVEALFSTSANLSGDPIPTLLADLNPQLQAQCGAMIADHGASTMLPSTILDCTGSQPRLVREGALARSLLEQGTGIKILT